MPTSSKLIELTYFDPKAQVKLSAYADTIITDQDAKGTTISAIRFGGYPEMVQAMSDAIYGGVTVEARQNGETVFLNSVARGYRKDLSHDGVYAVSTMMANDDAHTSDKPDDARDELTEESNQPRKCYIFCPAGNRERLFEQLDRKTAAPLIPSFRDYVLDALIARGDLRPLQVFSLRERMDAWVLTLLPEDKNVVEVLEQGLRNGDIAIPGAVPGESDGFEEVRTVTGYLNAFGTTVAERIRTQFKPLFDPANEPLSEEILTINDYIRERAGYSLYDAQLAVAEATKRQLQRKHIALICAECGTGKTKIGSTALGALYGAQHHQKPEKSFGVVLSPSHVSRKWVREIGETLPNTYAMVVKGITDLDRLYKLYEQGDKNVYAVISKERARDGYMHYPAVTWNRRQRAFLCPDCMAPIEMQVSDDYGSYLVNADQFFFRRETKKNHKCACCGTPLWAPVNPGKKLNWVKIGEYGWVYRYKAQQHLEMTKNEAVKNKLLEIVDNPDGHYPIAGAYRKYPLSTYIKKKMRGKISGFLCDELHEYNNASGQGDAMAEIFAASKYFVGMTATLINGYSSGIFHLLYRIVAGLMLKDGKDYRSPATFDAEYGVVETTYEIRDPNYNSNRRTTKRKSKTRQLPGVSPLVFSRFLLEYTSFLTLTDMGKDLPDYEEIPIPLDMPLEIEAAYKRVERALKNVLKSDKKAAQKILSTYMNLLTVYPDQPYAQKEIIHPITGDPIIDPPDIGDFSSLYPKEEKVLEIVRRKIAAGERVLVYTSWTRTDSQQKLLEQLKAEGIRTEILSPQIPPEKREAWVEKRVSAGLQVLITNPRCVETGLDLNAFTTLIFYSMGYNLFTFRQASRRSWRINQLAPRIEVYMLYYKDTMQAKAMKLMASKLAVASIIEGTFTDEGLAAMSDVQDLTSQMAKELSLGIKDSVEDIAAAFKKMAIINPDRQVSKPAVEESTVVEVPVSIASSTRAAVSAANHAQYEELLARSMEEQKKRKRKKEVEDENQYSFFDYFDAA